MYTEIKGGITAASGFSAAAIHAGVKAGSSPAKDDLMLLVFEKFPADQHHLLLLREYSLRKPSLSALRVLYTRFASLQTRQELDAIASVARSCHPAFRLRGWLD